MIFDPIIPVMISAFLLANPAEELRSIQEEYGFHRFFLNFRPMTESNVLPARKEYEEFGRKVLELKESLKDINPELNWWCVPTLELGKSSDFQRIVNYDGTENEKSACPLDKEFRKRFTENVIATARIAHFPIIQFEDDFKLSTHPGAPFGCFCPLHLAELGKRIGRSISREELVKMYMENKKETLELRREFEKIKRDSLVLLAADIRRELDKVSPETRISVCESGATDLDGDIIARLPEVFAGSKTRPMVRLYGTTYCYRDSPQELPWMLAHAMFSTERLPASWELIHESDTFPHTRFFMSDTFLRSMMANAFFIGMDNSLLYACQYLDDPAEDKGYLRMANESRRFFNGILSINHKGHLDGVRILHTPESVSMPCLSEAGGSIIGDTAWLLARLGIPYSTKYGSPIVLTGAEASVLSDEEIKRLLSGPLLLDAIAAENLDKRGFADLTGVRTENPPKYDFSYEFLADIPDFARIKGRKLYNYASIAVATEASQYRRLVPMPGTETLSYLADHACKPVQPGICRFVNRQGGRIGVLACSLKDNVSSNMLCHRKMQMLQILVEWLRGSELPARVSNAPNVWIQARETSDELILAVTSLTLSRLQDVEIAVSQDYQGAVEELGEDGAWHEAKIQRMGTFLVIQELQTQNPRIFKIQKRH